MIWNSLANCPSCGLGDYLFRCRLRNRKQKAIYAAQYNTRLQIPYLKVAVRTRSQTLPNSTLKKPSSWASIPDISEDFNSPTLRSIGHLVDTLIRVDFPDNHLDNGVV